MNKLLSSNLMPLPHMLFLEVCSHCNLKCIMCPKTHGHVNTAENQVMSREVFDRCKAIFPSITHAELSGLWGEAFIPGDTYIEYLKELKEHEIHVTTISNGTLITEDLAAKLVDEGLDRLVVSMDAATDETYAHIRPPGDFQAVVRGLAAIRDAKQATGKTTPQVGLAFVGMKDNISELPALIKLAGELKADRVFLQAMGEYEGIEGASIAREDKPLGRRYADEAQQIANELGIEFGLQPPDQFEEDRGDRNETTDTTGMRKACLDPWTKAIVTASGDVLPCCSSTRPYGSLTDQSFEEIWYGKAYKALRKTIKTDKPMKMCKLCTGVAWEPCSFKRDLKQSIFWTGIELKRQYGHSPLFNAVKPVLKMVRRLLAGQVRDPEEARGTAR